MEDQDPCTTETTTSTTTVPTTASTMNEEKHYCEPLDSRWTCSSGMGSGSPLLQSYSKMPLSQER